MRSRPFLIACIALPLALGVGAARADDAEVAQLREQLRATVLQLRQLQDQQASTPQPTPAAPVAPASRPAISPSKMRALRARAAQADRAQADLAKARADYAALTETAAATSAELAKVKAAYTQAADQARDLTTEQGRLRLQLTAASNAATACQAKNARLIAFAEELLASYRKVGLAQALGGHEPLLGLERVKLENLAQDREDKVRADRCDPRIDAAAPTPTPPAGG